MRTFKQFAKITKYSQWGEEGIIDEIFRLSPPVDRSCFEFGAADGLFFSNTASLWENGWKTLLVESDPAKFEKLLVNTAGHPRVTCVRDLVDDIDRFAPTPLDLISIDVDGEEHSLFERMRVRHRVVIIEHNPTMAACLSIIGGNGTGSSARALIELGESKGYRFLTSTLTNCVFIADELFDPFTDFDTSLEANFDAKHVGYVYTDYRGKRTVIGDLPY